MDRATEFYWPEKKACHGFCGEIDEWMTEPVNWFYSEFWPQGWSRQGRSLAFFSDLDAHVVKALGVKIVESEHPGSSYYAALFNSTAPIPKAGLEKRQPEQY